MLEYVVESSHRCDEADPDHDDFHAYADDYYILGDAAGIAPPNTYIIRSSKKQQPLSASGLKRIFT
jgi:hypothetical protein